jgi:hypothetical protein
LQTVGSTNLLRTIQVTSNRGVYLSKKSVSAEEQKKKQAYYYSKGEKKAKAVKKK